MEPRRNKNRRSAGSDKGSKIQAICYSIGIAICLATLILPMIGRMKSDGTVSTFKSNVEEVDDQSQQKMLDDAAAYNSMLFQTQAAGITLAQNDILSDAHYNELLNYSDGMMGMIDIPKISLSYPIYHGTSDEVLNAGIGHIEGTSLPVGGNSTRAVLSGHRGLPTSKLFTRLDELVKGDLIFITTGKQKLAYSVNDIQVVEPDNTDVLQIQPDKDLVTLITCTPYGINTQRLVITGERIPFDEQQEKTVGKKFLPSWTELAIIGVPFAIIFALLSALALKAQKA